MATKRKKTPTAPEPTPTQAYLAALKSRPDPAYTAFMERLGPERSAEFNEAAGELLRGRLTLMASRIAGHEEDRRMRATFEEVRTRMGLPPEPTPWIDERRQARDFADATAELHLARVVEARLARIHLAAEVARMRGGRPKESGNALTKLIRAYRGRHREATQGDVLAHLIALTRRRNPHPVVEAVTEHEDDYDIEWRGAKGQECTKLWSNIRRHWNDSYRPAEPKKREQNVKRRK